MIPSFVPSNSGVSQWVVHTRKAYSYYRAYASYLRRIKGRKRRVRVYRYRLVYVPLRRYLVWILELPRPDEYVFKRKEKPKWLSVSDYVYRIETQKSFAGYEITERDEIYHTSPNTDFVHIPSLFVWKRPVFPKGPFPILIKKFGVEKAKTPFHKLRIWFWVFHNEEKEYRLWSRGLELPHGVNFTGLFEFSRRYYKTVKDQIEEKYTYLEVHGLVAWSGWLLTTKQKRLYGDKNK